MLDSVFEAIEEWIRTLLTNMISSNLTTMFTDVNDKTVRSLRRLHRRHKAGTAVFIT